MMSETYTFSPCWACKGEGKSFDPTCQDKINPGPYANQCAPCRGTGTIGKLVSEYTKRAEVERIERLNAPVVIGDMPEWML